jgi:signal transduction protein with GAF and PtsI domain
MSAERALFDAYREWRRLARAGQKAIGRRDWNLLLECQTIVQKIQPAITGLRRQVRDEWQQSKVDCSLKQKELQALVLELKDLLESNRKLLLAVRAGAWAEALSRRQKLEQTGRNLKRLQNSYASAYPPAWSSFS